VQYPVAWSAGAMAGTAHDVALWIRALYGGSLLKPESLQQMTQWHEVPSPEFGLGYGLGTMRLKSAKGDFWGHTGVITGFITHAGHSPTLNVTVALLINQDGDFYTPIWDALIDAL
jgi:D-alanyl-D-alanine carboxypeptidase